MKWIKAVKDLNYYDRGKGSNPIITGDRVEYTGDKVYNLVKGSLGTVMGTFRNKIVVEWDEEVIGKEDFALGYYKGKSSHSLTVPAQDLKFISR